MRVQTRQLHHVTLLSVVENILDDPNSDLDEILLGFSRDHFNRFFRDAMGESLYEFVRRIRLERSVHGLYSGKPVSVVAVEAGYATAEAFAKAFRAEFGDAPTSCARGSTPTIIGNSNLAHWGDRRAPLSLDSVIRFAAGLVTLDDLEISAMLFRGDYNRIPDVWETLAKDISDEIKQSNSWITVFHSDGMRTQGRQNMMARIGHLYSGGTELPSFERYTIPGGSYVTSRLLNGQREHSEAWESFNKLWVPKSGPRPADYPAFDSYESFPVPFAEVQASVHLRLQ